MFKTMLLKLGYFLFEFGASILLKLMLGSEVTKEFEELVTQLQKEELTSKQKYNRAKKFLDQMINDLPDIAKNIAIEVAVSKIPDKGDKILKSIKNKL